MFRNAVFLACALLLLVVHAKAGTAADWRSRTIYQLLTDRFAGSANTPKCTNLGSYCGGTFSGIVSKLDYIQGMGFDAIWISPVIDNTDGGYHGYWARNINKINSNFGTASDLELLVKECHKRGMWVMVDVVGNHMGYGAPSAEFAPLSDPSNYHDCNACPQYCNIDDFGDQNQVELCRLVGLPDLNQTNPYVSNVLTTWIHDLVANYSFDGIRIDTVCEVNKAFWGDFKEASGVYSVGEVNNGDVGYVSSYQSTTPGTNAPGVDGTLSYPLYYSIRVSFAIPSIVTILYLLPPKLVFCPRLTFFFLFFPLECFCQEAVVQTNTRHVGELSNVFRRHQSAGHVRRQPRQP
jgi:alpha-amylase